MKVVITGATGFVGGALARTLIGSEVNLHALALPSSNQEPLASLPITWHVGDITVPNTLTAELFAAADWVIHAAGLLGRAGVPEETYQSINAQGTQNVLTAVRQHNPQARVLYISSAGVLGPYKGQTTADETSPLAPSNPYERSKAQAERIALQFAHEGLPVIIVRPEFIYGPGDHHVLGLFRMIQKGLFFYIGNGRNTCHPTYIDDAIDGILRCLRQGQPGHIYHITGPRPVTFRELATTIAHTLDVAPPRLMFPRPLVWLGALGLEILGQLTGRAVPLSRTGVAFFSENRRSTFAKAQQTLGYTPQYNLQTGIRHTITWYQENGLL